VSQVVRHAQVDQWAVDPDRAGSSRDPFGRGLFVFCNRGRDKIRCSTGAHGFVLWYKRLEKHRFAWSLPGDAES